MDKESTPKIGAIIGVEEMRTPLPDAAIRKAVKDVLKLKKWRGRRAEIADRLTQQAGFPVSANMLNDWCALSKPGLRFPLSLVRPFCEITGENELAFLAMPENIRENATLGEAVRPILEKWDAKEREKQHGRHPRKKGASK